MEVLTKKVVEFEQLMHLQKTDVKAKQNNTLLFGNASVKKNLHPGRRKFIFLTNFLEILSFIIQFLLLFLYFCSFSLFLLACLFFEIRNIYSDTHLTIREGE